MEAFKNLEIIPDVIDNLPDQILKVRLQIDVLIIKLTYFKG